MKHFQYSRFQRALINDLLLLDVRRILVASLGLMVIGCLLYLANTSAADQSDPTPVASVLFLVLLHCGGAIVTSMIFNDMHHPLERFHYLTLPISNLERFLSRYLITAPLFVLYAIALYLVFEVLANQLCLLLSERTVPPLDLGSEMVHVGIRDYFFVHVFVFAGAIWFRSYALIKTLFASFVFFALLGVVSFVALRIVYWDSFISLFQMNPDGPYVNIELGNFGNGSAWYQKLLFAAFLLWTLFLAFLGLKEHEVQDGL